MHCFTGFRFTPCLLALSLTFSLLVNAHAQPNRGQPVPADAEVAAVKVKIAEAYREDYAKAKTPQQRIELAAKIRGEGARPGNPLVERYALLIVARDISAGAGDWSASMASLNLLNQLFDVEFLDLVDEARAKIDLVEKPSGDPKVAYELLTSITELAVRKDRYDIAERMVGSAQRIAKRGGDTLTAKQLAEYVQEIQKRRRQFDAIAPELATLEKSPADAAANLAVGRYRCLQQGQWELGAPMLALGSDAELARLATLEIVAPTSGAEQLALADGWWELAEQRKADEKMLRRHALDWYLRASHQLDGLKQRQALARLEEAEKWHSKEATYVTSSLKNESDKRFAPLPSLLNESEKYHDIGSKFAFHLTGADSYITIDLKRDLPISRLHIFNRATDSHRARGMTVYVSSSPQHRGEAVWRAPDGAAEWNVLLPKLAVGRYITIAFDPTRNDDAIFHLRKVKILGPEER